MELIPSKDRQEWKDLLNGKLDIKIENFVLQMQVDQTKRAIKNETLNLEDGVTKIHGLCEKYSSAVQKDMGLIFNK